MLAKFFKKVSFVKFLTVITFGYVIYCSAAKVENAIAYIGFLLTLVTLWTPQPPDGFGRKDSDSRDPYG